MAGAAPRRRNLIGHRRRIEDEGEDEGGPEAHELYDDSLTEGSIGTDDHDAADDSDTSNIDEASPTSPNARKVANGAAKPASKPAVAPTADSKQVSDTELMLHGLSIADQAPPTQDMHFDEVDPSASQHQQQQSNGPVVVSSASAGRQPPGTRRRQEHEDYKRRRDEDPAFVPNRGAFFMHDHRHPGPSANGFRPFAGARGRGRGGRGGVGGPYAPMKYVTLLLLLLSVLLCTDSA